MYDFKPTHKVIIKGADILVKLINKYVCTYDYTIRCTVEVSPIHSDFPYIMTLVPVERLIELED